MDTRPIGVFDSGLGGLTVLRQMIHLLPRERFVYFGDTAHVPYGSKSAETVTGYSVAAAEFMAAKKTKLLVVACNTASALSLSEVRRVYPGPVVGVLEPGAASALKLTKNGRIGVIGTEATIRSGAYARQLKKLSPDVRVFELACPLFVPLVEEGWWNKKVAELAAREYLSRFKKTEIDTLILGCTHYPVMKRVIAKVIGKTVRLVDSAQAAAEAAGLLLGGVKSSGGKSGAKFFSSDDPERFCRLAKNILGFSPGEVKLKKL